MQFLIKIWFCLFLLSASSFLAAQEGVRWVHELSDLPENFTLDIAITDEDQRIWIGNSSGLWVFDGIDCREFISLDLGSKLTALHVLSIDSIALGTSGGDIYTVINKKIIQHDIDTAIKPESINQVNLQSDGSLWFSSQGDGLFHLRNDSIINLSMEAGLPSPNISDFVKLDSSLWIATDNGLVRGRIRRGKIADLKVFNEPEGLADPLVTCLGYSAISDQLYVGTHSAGIYEFTGDHFTQIISSQQIQYTKHIQVIQNNTLLIQADSPSTSLLDLRDKKLNTVDIPGTQATKTLFTNDGFIWTFTEDRQLVQNSIYFTKFEAPFTPQAIVSKGDQIWIGTQKGLFKAVLDDFAISWNEIESFSGQNIISLEFQNEQLLVGTFGEGLIYYAPKSGLKIKYTMENGLPDQSILDIFFDGTYTWLGTLGGLVRTRWDEERITEIESFVDTVYVYHVDQLDDKLYFSTHGDGAGYINGKIQWFTDSILSHGEISSFGLLEGGQALFSTSSDGLIYHNNGQNYKVRTPTHINFETTSSIVADSMSGRFFISHAHGLDIFDPSDSSVVHLGNNLKLNFSTSALNAHAYNNDMKKHFFGSANGLFCIEPDLYALNSAPQVDILSIKVNGQEESLSKLAHLKSNERTVQLEILPIWYTDPRSLTYRYKLSGLHEDWIQTSDAKIIFPDIPYGSYEFQLQAGIYGDYNENAQVNLPFKVAFPLWMRWWFIILAILAVIGLIYAYVKNREVKLQKWARLEKERANAQIQAMKSQVSPHFMFNSFNTLIALIEEAPDKAVRYAEDLSDFFRNLVSKRNEDVNSLEEEIELAKSYVELLKTRFGNNLNLHIDIDDMEGYVLTYTLQILTENVVKHNVISKSEPLRFRISREEDWLVVENNYLPKYSVKDSTGFGLESIRERYRILLKKDIIINKTEKHFVVKIPIIKNR